MSKGLLSLNVGDYRPISITLLLSKVFEKIVTGKLSQFLVSNSLFPPSQFWYRRSMAACDALLTFSHYLQVALDKSIQGRLVQLDLSATFDAVSHCGLSSKNY